MKRVLALLALILVAAYGLLLGPSYGEGTDDRAARLVPGTPPTLVPSALDAWTPRSDADERLRFAAVGGGALLVLVVVLLTWRERAPGADSPRL
jgi:ABC-type cobalt transport system substrate-binding protein